jgi:hypothetical protein
MGVQYGSVFRTLSADGHQLGKLKIAVNSNSTGPLDTCIDFEGLSALNDIDRDLWWFQVEWKWWWIHLYKGATLVRSEGQTVWLDGGNNSYSTNWWGCCEGNGNPGDYRASCSFSVRGRRSGGAAWSYAPNSPVRMSSDPKRLGC